MFILPCACRFGYLSQYLPIFGTVLWSNEFVSAKVRMIIDSKSMSARPTKDVLGVSNYTESIWL